MLDPSPLILSANKSLNKQKCKKLLTGCSTLLPDRFYHLKQTIAEMWDAISFPQVNSNFM